MNKKKLKLALAILIFLFVFLFAVYNPAVAFSGSGSGTSGDPFQITTCAQLQEMNADLGAHYKLMNNIDCRETIGWNSGAGFLPVGSEWAPFTGSLDGRGRVIKGHNIKVQSTECANIAIFGKILGSSIKDLGLENVSVITANCARVATLVARADSSSINKITAQGYVSGHSTVAGLVALLVGGSINNSYVDVDVRGVKPVNDTRNVEVLGGIVGIMGGTIQNVYVTSDVVSADPSSRVIGGMVGKSGSVLLLNSFATGNVTGAIFLGGIMGSSSDAIIHNSYYNNHAYNPDVCLATGAVSELNCTIIEDNQSYFRYSINQPMSNWDFTNTWSICAGERLPFLKWQNTTCDNDGVIYEDDNCPEAYNPGQEDADGDGIGNACTIMCGNGILEYPEFCDDGNSIDNDACSNTCQAKEVETTFQNATIDNNGNGTYDYEFVDQNVTLVDVPNNNGLINLEDTLFDIKDNPNSYELSISDLVLSETTKSVTLPNRDMICAVDEADFVAESANNCLNKNEKIIWSAAGGNACGESGNPVQAKDKDGNNLSQYTCEKFTQGSSTYALMKGFNHTYIAMLDDNDVDGHPAIVDCNDNNATIFPGAPETCGDSIDNDCSGIADDLDNDNDNVTECGNDKCLSTSVPESIPSLLSEKYADVDGDFAFETVESGQIVNSQYTMMSTYGCSCTQILDCKPGVNTGEYEHGCENGTFGIWISQTGWATNC